MSSLRVLAATPRTLSFLAAPADARHSLETPLSWVLETAEGTLVAQGAMRKVVLFVEGLEPGCDYRLVTPLGTISGTTRPCAGLVEAAELGVHQTNPDNGPALTRAIGAVPPGGTLRLPAGRYLSGPIFLKRDMTLYLESGAELAAIGDRTHWPRLPARDEAGRVLGTWEGLPEPCYAALITAVDCTRLALTGGGTIDGGGDRGDWWSWPKETRDGARRPRTVHLAHSDCVTVSGLTIRNSPSWTVHPYRCRDLHFSALRIENPPNSPNTDGLNPESCERVEITGVAFSVGDDCIAIKAGKRAPDETEHLAPTRDVAIAHCRMERGHGAVVIGSEMSGGVHDVEIAHCDFIATDRGLRIKTRRGRGGEVSGIRLRDTAMQDVPTPLAINAFYFCDPDGKDDWVQSRVPAPVTETTPTIRDITLTRVTARGVSLAGAALLGLPEAPIEGVRLSECSLTFAPDARPDVPLMALGVPPVRHARITAQFAQVTGTIADMPPDKDPAHMLMEYFDAYARNHRPYKGGAWCYEDGLVYRGLELLHRATGEARWLDHIIRLADAQIGTGPSLAGYDPSDYNIDNILSGRTLLYLHQVTGETRYIAAAQLLGRQLAQHPRTRSGVYWHKLRYPWQVWLDGLYMGPPFQIGLGQHLRDDRMITDAITQVSTALDMAFVTRTGLYAHAVDEARMQPWADTDTGHSGAHWARAIGWLAMALVDIAELTSTPEFAPLAARSRALFDRIAALQQPGGLWLQVIDQPALPGNYEETSASAMFVYALLRASELGLWRGDAEPLARCLLERAVKPKPGGGLEMVEICHVAGLGPFEDRFRDGSAEYYLSEPLCTDDPKGVGPLMMVEATRILQAERRSAACAGQ
ncbi:Polygalacturonase [Poseidonocella pacifica]|uniref:Polygalacturonase n=1 Tax=Poseidonocella pacifica TaxID=871651 RepID=A0A1I0XK84_9RHOB|nr:glycoside hydrolase family 88 protein [Poseidonocella pacifica]SFB01107.1 Polygalacturonase [Poseidonocella pacifica]